MKSLKRWLVENQDSCARVAARDSGKMVSWNTLLQRTRVDLFRVILDAGFGGF